MTITNWTPQRLAIWRNMSPESRDYDRVMARSFPPGQGGIETKQWREYVWERDRERAESYDPDSHECSCHTNPPCSHCESCEVCNCEACDDWHDTAGGEVCPKKEDA